MTGNPLSLLMQSLTLKQAVVDLEPAEMTIEDWLLQVSGQFIRGQAQVLDSGVR